MRNPEDLWAIFAASAAEGMLARGHAASVVASMAAAVADELLAEWQKRADVSGGWEVARRDSNG